MKIFNLFIVVLSLSIMILAMGDIQTEKPIGHEIKQNTKTITPVTVSQVSVGNVQKLNLVRDLGNVKTTLYEDERQVTLNYQQKDVTSGKIVPSILSKGIHKYRYVFEADQPFFIENMLTPQEETYTENGIEGLLRQTGEPINITLLTIRGDGIEHKFSLAKECSLSGCKTEQSKDRKMVTVYFEQDGNFLNVDEYEVTTCEELGSGGCVGSLTDCSVISDEYACMYADCSWGGSGTCEGTITDCTLFTDVNPCMEAMGQCSYNYVTSQCVQCDTLGETDCGNTYTCYWTGASCDTYGSPPAVCDSIEPTYCTTEYTGGQCSTPEFACSSLGYESCYSYGFYLYPEYCTSEYTGGQCSTSGGAATYNYLSSNITSSGTCMTITASNIILDCKKHKITFGTGGGSYTYGLYLTSANNVTIQNCTVLHGSASGTNNMAFQASSSDYGTLKNNFMNMNAVHDSNYAGYLLSSSYWNVTRNFFNGSKAQSRVFATYAGSQHNTFFNNTFYGNNNAPFQLHQNSDYANVAYNKFIGGNYVQIYQETDGVNFHDNYLECVYGLLVQSDSSSYLNSNNVVRNNIINNTLGDDCQARYGVVTSGINGLLDFRTTEKTIYEENKIYLGRKGSYGILTYGYDSTHYERYARFINNTIYLLGDGQSGGRFYSVDSVYVYGNNITGNTIYSYGENNTCLIDLKSYGTNQFNNNTCNMIGDKNVGYLYYQPTGQSSTKILNNQFLFKSKNNTLLWVTTKNKFNVVMNDTTYETPIQTYIGDFQVYNNSKHIKGNYSVLGTNPLYTYGGISDGVYTCGTRDNITVTCPYGYCEYNGGNFDINQTCIFKETNINVDGNLTYGQSAILYLLNATLNFTKPDLWMLYYPTTQDQLVLIGYSGVNT